MLIYDVKSYDILEVNKAATEKYGYEKDEFLSKTIFDIRPDEDRKKLMEHIENRQNNFSDAGLWRHKKKNGEIIYAHISSHETEYNQRQARLVLMQDVTKQKEYEVQLLELNRNLEEIVEKRTAQLSEYNRQLEEANAKITEQANIIRKQNEEKLNRILNALDEVVWSYDLRKDRYLYLSRSAERISGVAYRDLLKDKEAWCRAIFEEDRSLFRKRVVKLARSGRSETTFRLISPGGKAIWIYDKATLVRDDNGRPLRIEGISTDISSLKYAEDEIIEYAHKLNMILESITDGFCTVNREWRFSRVTKVFEKMIRQNRKDLLGAKIWKALSPRRHPELARRLSAAMDQKRPESYEGYFEEYESWLHIKAYPYVDGLSVFVRDVTREKEMQKEALQGKLNLDALINNTDDLIWSVDKNMNLLSANKSYKEALRKYGKLEAVSGATVISPVLPEARQSVDFYAKALHGEAFKIVREYNLESETRYAEISYNPIFDDQGMVIGVGCFARDITGRKRYEQERTQLIEKLVAQNKDLEEFGYVTSHKMRAPIANILGIMKVFNKENLNDELNLTLLDHLETAVNNLDNIIRDLTKILDLQKKSVDVKEEVDLRETIEQVKSMLAPELEETRTTLTYSLKTRRIYSIKSYLLNILVNLISNSIKYKKPGRDPRIEICAYSKNGYWCIRITDNGLGIDLARYRRQLFQLYKRFHLHTKGRGIGLYLVKYQVDALDGKLEVFSKVDEGSTFKVYLKKETEAALPSPAPAERETTGS